MKSGVALARDLLAQHTRIPFYHFVGPYLRQPPSLIQDHQCMVEGSEFLIDQVSSHVFVRHVSLVWPSTLTLVLCLKILFETNEGHSHVHVRIQWVKPCSGFLSVYFGVPFLSISLLSATTMAPCDCLLNLNMFPDIFMVWIVFLWVPIYVLYILKRNSLSKTLRNWQV